MITIQTHANSLARMDPYLIQSITDSDTKTQYLQMRDLTKLLRGNQRASWFVIKITKENDDNIGELIEDLKKTFGVKIVYKRLDQSRLFLLFKLPKVASRRRIQAEFKAAANLHLPNEWGIVYALEYRYRKAHRWFRTWMTN